MTRTRNGAFAVLALTVAALAALLAGCTGGGYASTPVPGPSTSAPTSAAGAPSPTATTTTAGCTGTEYLRSYDPDPNARGGLLQRIKNRGRLIAGVSADTLTFGARNPVSGQIEGFDIDRLRAISRALFGDPGKIEFRVITTAQRIPVLQDGDVDIVARTMTINCDRWTQVAFSGRYYEAGQKVLVSLDSRAKGLQDLGGKRVCAPNGSTSLTFLEKQYPDVTAVGAATHTGCLALFQQGEVDAITGDDTVLAGLAAQDPYAKVVGEKLTSEPYGLAMPKGERAFVQFVNAVLEQEKSNGAWKASYDRWLADALGPAPQPPDAVFGRR